LNYLKTEVHKTWKWEFNLENGPLLRVRLFRLSDREHALLIGMHHIVSDGWSVKVLLEEIMNLHSRHCKNENYEIDALTIQYKEYALWLNEKSEGIKA